MMPRRALNIISAVNRYVVLESELVTNNIAVATLYFYHISLAPPPPPASQTQSLYTSRLQSPTSPQSLRPKASSCLNSIRPPHQKPADPPAYIRPIRSILSVGQSIQHAIQPTLQLARNVAMQLRRIRRRNEPESNPGFSTDQITAACEQIRRLLQQPNPTPSTQPITYQMPIFVAVPGSHLKHKRNVKTRGQHTRKKEAQGQRVRMQVQEVDHV